MARPKENRQIKDLLKKVNSEHGFVISSDDDETVSVIQKDNRYFKFIIDWNAFKNASIIKSINMIEIKEEDVKNILKKYVEQLENLEKLKNCVAEVDDSKKE